MREIKFRAWNKLLKKMVRLDKIKFWHELIYEIEDNTIGGKKTTFSGNNDTIELSQFTGLIDRNNRMIFEGDILWHDCHIDEHPEMCIVKFAYASFYIVEKDDQDTEDYCMPLFSVAIDNKIKCPSLEVIGNVWENPEFIK